MKVSIVILAWNASHLTKACLKSLNPTLRAGDQVIVVNNGSVDDTIEVVEKFDWVDPVICFKNHGFAGGNNRGAAIAENDIIIFLNNDTLFPDREWISKLVDPFYDGRVVATGPASDNVSGIQGVINSKNASAHYYEIERLVGFCLAVRRSTFEQVGGFDENFATGGYEDDDLGIRLMKHGMMVFCPFAFVQHLGHKTFDANGLDWYAVQERNRLYFEEKHG